jgi:hypothetical protein
MDFANEEAGLWELTYGRDVIPASGEAFEAWPAATPAELRPELAYLLREGKVELFAFGGRGLALTLDDALAEIERDDAWLPPPQSGRQGCEVALTPSGDAEGIAIANSLPLS